MALRIENLADEQVNEACALFAQVFAVHVTPEAWRWKYAAECLLGAINLVAYEADNALIGHVGAVVLAGVDEGHPRAMVQVCDVMVAGHRRGGVGSAAVYPALMRALRAEINARFPGAYAYGFPGKRPFLLGERLGFYQRAYDITEVVKPLPNVRKAFLGWPFWEVHALGWDALLLEADMFNRLWTREAASAGSPAAVRGAGYLHWRYAQHPTRRYTLLVLRRVWRNVAWWVLAAEGETLRVVDALGHEARSVRALELLGDWAAQQGFKRLFCWHPTQDETENATGIGIVAMQFALGSGASKDEPVRTPRFMPGDLDVF